MSQSITQISLLAAFSAGLLSFVSPCVLPLVPSYISYITGLSIEQLTDAEERSKFKAAIIVNALLFIAGFSAVFIAFGASASFIGQLLITYQDHIRRIGGVLIIVFGLYLLGVLNINFLQTEHRYQFRNRPVDPPCGRPSIFTVKKISGHPSRQLIRLMIAAHRDVHAVHDRPDDVPGARFGKAWLRLPHVEGKVARLVGDDAPQ